MNVRTHALNAYNRIMNDGGYSNIVISDIINDSELNEQDNRLLTELVYGTISKKLTLEFYLSPFIRGRMKAWQRNLLLMSIYQLIYLDRVPEYAVINEAVEMTKSELGFSESKVTNAILRNFTRTELRNTEDIKDPIKRLSIESSIPQWILNHWKTHYGIEETKRIAMSLTSNSELYIRTNTKKISREDLLEKLSNDNIEVAISPLHPDALIAKTNRILSSPWFHKGYYSVQDVSSMFVNTALNPADGDHILDCCAAPGGKGLHALEKLNEGHVSLADVFPHKIKLINQAAKRLELKDYKAFIADATTFDYGELYDKIIVDAPCSGLGVMRRKPEIRYEVKESDIESLVTLQLEILNNVSKFLKPGGVLVYSTCTIHQMENENVAYTFKKTQEDYDFLEFELPTLDFKGNMRQILPHEFDTDGFFIAKFIRKAEDHD